MSRCLKLFCKTTQKEYHGQFKERCGHHYFDENLCFCNKCVTQLQFDTITQLRRSRLSGKPNNHKNENVSSAIALNIKKGVFQAQINCGGLHAIGIACLLAHYDYKELHTETNELKCIAHQNQLIQTNTCNVLHLTNMFSFTSPPTSTPTTLTTTTQCIAALEDATVTTTSVTMVR